MFNVRLAGGHLYGKQLFTWLSLVVSLMACFVLSFFPLDVLDEIWDLIESVSEGFLTYSFRYQPFHLKNQLFCSVIIRATEYKSPEPRHFGMFYKKFYNAPFRNVLQRSEIFHQKNL